MLERVDESGFRRELLAYQAEIDEKRPGGGAEAERVYQEILALDPLHFGAYRALTRLFRDAERWTDLRQLLEVRQENLPEPKERLTLLWQIAEIDEALLDDRHHAIATLQQITEVDRQDIRAYRALEKHYVAAEGWKELESLLERQQPLVPAAEKRRPGFPAGGDPAQEIWDRPRGRWTCSKRWSRSVRPTARPGSCSNRSCPCPGIGSGPRPSSSLSTRKMENGPSWSGFSRPRSSRARACRPRPSWAESPVWKRTVSATTPLRCEPGGGSSR